MGVESHYHSKKDRVFVRGIAGPVQPEGRARAAARDAARDQGRRTSSSTTARRPSAGTTSSRRTASRRRFHVHLEEYAPGRRSRRSTATSTRRPSTSSTARLRDPRRRPLRLESRRRRHRAQQLRAPALQREPRQAGARAGDEDQADVHVHEHAVPADGRAAADEPRRRQARATVPRRITRIEPATTRGEMSHGLERIEGVEAGHGTTRSCTRAARGCGGGAGAQRASARRSCTRRTCPGSSRRRGC